MGIKAILSIAYSNQNELPPSKNLVCEEEGCNSPSSSNTVSSSAKIFILNVAVCVDKLIIHIKVENFSFLGQKIFRLIFLLDVTSKKIYWSF